MRRNPQSCFVGFATVVLAMALPIVAAAQARPNSSRRGTPIGSAPDSVRETRERDMNIRRLELEKERPAKSALEVSPETIKQVNEDFAKIQGINAEIIQDYASGKPPNYKHISEAMMEIKKRAERLNANLLLPPGDSDNEDRAKPTGIKRAEPRSPLLDLNDLIHDFVTNPIFKNVNTIDLALGAKAKRDLESIVDLSDRISKSADKLNKTSATR